MKKYYAGIGSRNTPLHVQNLMTQLAKYLKSKGYALRSGHALGADWAFEQGAGEDSLIFLPWPNFGVRQYRDDLGRPVLGTCCIASENDLFDNYQMLMGIRSNANVSRSVKLLHGRNVLQVENAKFVICWCEEIDGKPQGGTATAVQLAKHRGLPVVNLWESDNYFRVEKILGGVDELSRFKNDH